MKKWTNIDSFYVCLNNDFFLKILKRCLTENERSRHQNKCWLPDFGSIISHSNSTKNSKQHFNYCLDYKRCQQFNYYLDNEGYQQFNYCLDAKGYQQFNYYLDSEEQY